MRDSHILLGKLLLGSFESAGESAGEGELNHQVRRLTLSRMCWQLARNVLGSARADLIVQPASLRLMALAAG